MQRRQLLGTALAAPISLGGLGGGAGLSGRSALASDASLPLGEPEAFSPELVVDRARALASEPYRPPPAAAEALERITYDVFQRIRFDIDRSLWLHEVRYPIAFFHLNRFTQTPVRIHVVQGEEARPLIYDPAAFDIADRDLAEALPPDLGYGGFRVMSPALDTDWLAFMGASYFRTAGAENQYGLSARGIAVNTAMDRGEEFPRFTNFWLVKPRPASDVLEIHTLLDGPSLAGAFRFRIAYGGGVLMDIDMQLFPRTRIERLGVAPMTSMFWYGEHNRHQATDWRPEIHDSDGLSLWTGADERIWRPLNNPRALQINAYLDTDPNGFGLMQRDRDFANYQDDGVFYDRRPNLWAEPLDPWGEGAVELVEIPTDDEIYDNIVAFWRPRTPPEAGEHLHYRYRLHWTSEEPFPSERFGRVVSTRIGRGGRPGIPRPEGVKKFVIDFEGGDLETLLETDPVALVVNANEGEIVDSYTLQVVDTRMWRAVFDLSVVGDGPINLNAHLHIGGRRLTEQWVFQYFPFSFDI